LAAILKRKVAAYSYDERTCTPYRMVNCTVW